MVDSRSDSRSKVIPLKAGSGSGGDHTGSQPLPMPLARLQERVGPALLRLTQGLFDQADDALFELADRAGSNAEQNVFFESMREVRIRRRAIEQGVVQRLRDGLHQLAYGGAESAGPDLEDISVNNLSLVEHDELEQLVAADSMAAKGEKQFGEALQTLTLRLDTLAAHQKVNARSNPLAPLSLCQSFIDECRPLNMDIKAKLVLFKLFDRTVLNQLGDFYQQANAVLSEEGILPGLVSSERVAPKGGRSAPRNDAGSGSSGYSSQAESEQVFGQLSQLLNQVRGGRYQSGGHSGGQSGGSPQRGSGLAAPGAAPALPRDMLMQLLAEVQQSQIQDLGPASEQHFADPTQFDVLRHINQLVQTKLPDRTVSIAQSDDDAINLVSMLFQFILEDRNLAAPIKGLLARLQIPILKLAMQDKSFFGKGGHPARKFLNEVATASLGWAPSGPLDRDPFYAKVEELVSQILEEFDGTVALFQDALAEFVSYVELERRRASLVERRTIDAEDGRARAEVARATVQQALDEKVAGRTLPRALVRLLEDGWSHVLFLTCLREGTDSPQWREALATVDDVLASVQPVGDAAERTLLIRRLPALLKQLRTGLTRIGFDPHEMNRLFADLERIHLSRLRQPEPAPEPTPETPTLDQVLDARDTDLEALDRELDAALELPAETAPEADAAPAQPQPEASAEAAAETADAGSGEAEVSSESRAEPQAESQAELEAEPQVSAASRARVEGLRVGCWVEFREGGEKRGEKVVRCRLAAIIKATGRYIFVNRAGVKVAEHNLDSLAQALDEDTVKFLDDGQLFDRALESVIGSLRDMKRPSPR